MELRKYYNEWREKYGDEFFFALIVEPSVDRDPSDPNIQILDESEIENYILLEKTGGYHESGDNLIEFPKVVKKS